jgi:uncharacterized protein YqgV (UPF0045/DUF77 family)
VQGHEGGSPGCHRAGAKRVLTTLRVDERLGRPRTMEERVERVMAKVK